MKRNFKRRRLVQATAAALGAVLTSNSRATDADIEQPAQADAQHFMERAFAMRELARQSGDQLYGAIVVKDGIIVGHGPSRVTTNHDPTAHGEMEALRDAGRRLGTNDLSGCEIYTTAKPCPMCETACYWARVSVIYYGADIVNAGQPKYSSC